MAKKQYRTREQLESIFDTAANGNWKDAYEECDEAGVYANDLLDYIETLEDEGEIDNQEEMLKDAVCLAEGAMQLRMEKRYGK